jgi:hypothetical protein
VATLLPSLLPPVFISLVMFPARALGAVGGAAPAAAPDVAVRQALRHTLFTITVCMVAFNKVVTAQYFSWWLCLAPVLDWVDRRRGTAKSAQARFGASSRQDDFDFLYLVIVCPMGLPLLQSAPTTLKKSRPLTSHTHTHTHTHTCTVYSGSDSFLPLLPRPRTVPFWVVLFGGWYLCQAAWLSQGYAVEFLGLPNFVPMWLAAMAMFAANCVIIVAVIRYVR